VPAALVRGVREALRTANGRALVDVVEHPVVGRYEAVRNPVKIDGARAKAGAAPPELGRHTDKILRQLGYAKKDIERLRRDGII
jgi:crotonobetainyl-CoA:carnitine CoA-transferase CaiB-like acyl-CoA transferase